MRTDPDPELVLKHLTNTVVLIGQTINNRAILASLGDIKSVKRQLKDHMEELQGGKKMLFGTEFQKHLKAVTKAQVSAEKLFTKTDLSTSSSRKRPYPSSRSPFSTSSSYGSSRQNQGGENSYKSRGSIWKNRDKLL